jgi:hypothetical protein
MIASLTKQYTIRPGWGSALFARIVIIREKIVFISWWKADFALNIIYERIALGLLNF